MKLGEILSFHDVLAAKTKPVDTRRRFNVYKTSIRKYRFTHHSAETVHFQKNLHTRKLGGIIIFNAVQFCVYFILKVATDSFLDRPR